MARGTFLTPHRLFVATLVTDYLRALHRHRLQAAVAVVDRAPFDAHDLGVFFAQELAPTHRDCFEPSLREIEGVLLSRSVSTQQLATVAINKVCVEWWCVSACDLKSSGNVHVLGRDFVANQIHSGVHVCRYNRFCKSQILMPFTTCSRVCMCVSVCLPVMPSCVCARMCADCIGVALCVHVPICLQPFKVCC